MTKLQLSLMVSRGQESLKNSLLKVAQRFRLLPHSKKVLRSVLGDFLGVFCSLYIFSVPAGLLSEDM